MATRLHILRKGGTRLQGTAKSKNQTFVLVSHLPLEAINLARDLMSRGYLAAVIGQRTSPLSAKYVLKSLLELGVFLLLGKQPPENWLFFCFSVRALFRLRGKVFFTRDINEDPSIRAFLEKSPEKFAITFGGQVISANVLNCFGGDWVNGHGGVLPRYRGLRALERALEAGDMEGIGVTIHELTPEIDKGDIYKVTHLVPESGQTVGQLQEEVERLIASSYLEFVEELVAANLDIRQFAVIPADWTKSGSAKPPFSWNGSQPGEEVFKSRKRTGLE